ncbi:MAG: M20/M25/M40 family metallo-hydrolase [Fibrobacteria bacterium]|nr:M20/M25/M40 family metallo-hydrolase [Fibrobacteria bacterium]
MDDINLQKAIEYYRNNQSHFIELLKALSAIPSISFPGYSAQEMERSAQFIKKEFEKLKLEHVDIITLPGAHPYICADICKHPNAPTILLYAHHDVQPPLRAEVWNSPAFSPEEREGRLYGRGTADDKAGIILHIASLASCIAASGCVPLNIKLLIEGEEETGSEHIDSFLQANPERIKADCVIIADSANFDTGIPSLTTSLRGLAVLEVTVSALESPLHSGLWGGPIPDPVIGLSKILSSLTNKNGDIAIPELTKLIPTLSKKDNDDIMSIPYTTDMFRQQARVKSGVNLHGKNQELLFKIWRQPSININGIESGGKKVGNVIMDKAWARVGLRLAPEMPANKCVNFLKKFLVAKCPHNLHLEIDNSPAVDGWQTDTTHPAFETARKCMQEAYEAEPVIIGSGGSIPLVLSLANMLEEVPILLTGIEDPYTNAHSENESLCLSDFHKAVESQIRFFYALASTS